MGKIPMEDERGKERLQEFNKDVLRHYTCVNCGNNTFVMMKCMNFPYFDTMCAKCGCIEIFEGRLGLFK